MLDVKRTVCIALAFAALTACTDGGNCDTDQPENVAFSNGAALTVRIADTPDERAHGLMGVTSLPPDEGMAFVFGGSTQEPFWMKDTLIPLSIAFVDGDRVVSIREMVPCTGDPCPTYDAEASYTYALEANRGWFDTHGIEAGDSVRSFDESHCQ
jgi:uncharacterized membrane protein (UPF0127 family)